MPGDGICTWKIAGIGISFGPKTRSRSIDRGWLESKRRRIICCGHGQSSGSVPVRSHNRRRLDEPASDGRHRLPSGREPSAPRTTRSTAIASQPRERLVPKAGDVYDTAVLTKLIRGQDPVISAFNPGWKDPNLYEHQVRRTASIIAAVKKQA
jgi:hypothetical protein